MIYFVKCAVTGFVKVGSTGDSVKALSERIGQLRVGPTPLSVVGTTVGNRETEVAFHKWLHGLGRHAGFGEWFTVHRHELPWFHIEIPEDLKTPKCSPPPSYFRTSTHGLCSRCGYGFIDRSKHHTRKYCSDVCRSKVLSEVAAARRGKPMSQEAKEAHYRTIRKVMNGKTLRELCEEHGISRGCVVDRMSRGMTIEEALTHRRGTRYEGTLPYVKTMRGPLNDARVRAGLAISDVARLAGVSTMTVSRALREDCRGTETGRVARRTREAIARAIHNHVESAGDEKHN